METCKERERGMKGEKRWMRIVRWIVNIWRHVEIGGDRWREMEIR